MKNIAFFLFFTPLSGCIKSGLLLKKGAATIIGPIIEQNTFLQIEIYKLLANYISKKANVNIELKALTSYGNIINNALNMDCTFFGNLTYSLAHSKLGVEVIVRPEKIKGTSTFVNSPCLYFIRSFTTPTDLLHDTTKQLKAGNLDFKIDVLKDNFREVIASFNKIVASLKEHTSKIQRTESLKLCVKISAG